MLEHLSSALPDATQILTDGALRLVAQITETYAEALRALVAGRPVRRATLEFRAETLGVREGDWVCAPYPAELADRRVEITGPVDRKMVINALNSGANVFMADFEDSCCPTWDNILAGQINVRDANARTITLETGAKRYQLNEFPAVLFVRPRGLHLTEAHVTYAGRAVPAAIFDFCMYAAHNTQVLLARGSAPYFYLPKLESHLEARLWNDMMRDAEAFLGVARGTLRATVLIETLPAAFQMDEILYELRERSLGLNCGRWDYIFSFIKTQASDPSALLPNRAEVTMDRGFLLAYAQLLIRTCHRRGTFAMGGMAAQIPIKGDAAANDAAMEKVRADKLREVHAGHDGTWVAHPALVPIARAVFDAAMPAPNQIDKPLSAMAITRSDLLQVAPGNRTEAGLRHNIRVAVQYIESWLRGAGCVPIYHLMEDAATAEISRAQVWQWVRHAAKLENGTTVDAAMVTRAISEELTVIERELGKERFAAGRFTLAAATFEKLALAADFTEFLTLDAYARLVAEGQ
jgi:malate synthase